MRALLLARPVLTELPGGDKVHAEKTAHALRQIGVDVDLTTAWAPDLTHYDVVHIFNVGDETLAEPMLRHALRARGWRRPIVLTPIYWNLREFRARFGLTNSTRERREHALQSLSLRLASRVLPNSKSEAAMLDTAFPHVAARTSIVHVGVEDRFGSGNADRFCARYGLEPRGFILCAARYEPRKNQLALIAACATLGLPLVLAGDEYDASYSEQCRAAASRSRARLEFLPHLTHDELADAYAAARVHALPSWLETVGLSSLEAVAAGCNVVTTSNSGIAEYLGDDAWYCDAASGDSIRAAVEAAFHSPLRPEVGRSVAERFSWARVAEETLVAYGDVMVEHAERDDGDGWTAPLLPAEYIEHIEDLLQVQLETIALRDDEFGELQQHAANLEAQAATLEVQAANLQAHNASLEVRKAELENHTRALNVQLRHLQQELAELRATKLFRYSAPLRRLYGHARRS